MMAPRQQQILPSESSLVVSIKKKSWKRRVDVLMFCYFGFITCLSTLNILEKLKIIDWNFNITIDKLQGKIFFQFLLCYIQCKMIVGICLDGGKSFSSRFFQTRLMKFLG